MRETEATQLEAPEPFVIGDRAFHVKFGEGTVSAVNSRHVTVSFDKWGDKRIVPAFLERRRTAEIISFPASRIVRRIEHGRGVVVK
jgi:hypothetical protein